MATAVLAGVAVYSAISGKRASNQAASAQSSIDAQNTARIQREGKETIARTRDTQQRLEAEAVTEAAGTGFARGGTVDNYVQALKESHKKDLDWLEESLASNIDISQSEAALRYRTTKDQGTASLIQGLGNAASLGATAWGNYQAGGGWWS